jgi:(2Fe-2S) ferredoxin
MKQKVLMYVYNTWYGVHCYKKEDIEKIVNEVIKENKNEKDFIKLGVIAKRRCMHELNR